MLSSLRQLYPDERPHIVRNTVVSENSHGQTGSASAPAVSNRLNGNDAAASEWIHLIMCLALCSGGSPFQTGRGFSAAPPSMRHSKPGNEWPSMAAQLIGIQSSIGTLIKGMEAVLVVLKGNPLKWIDVVRDREKIVDLMKAGKFVTKPLSRY